MRKISFLIIMMIFMMMGGIVSFGVTENISDLDEPIVFSDQAFKSALIDLGADTDGNGQITRLEAASFSSGEILIDNKDIKDISGLKYFSGVLFLEITYNEVSDISELEHMPQLISLKMWGNNISDIRPLSHLKQLVFLDISENEISDISPLMSLEKLETLILWGNKISDIGRIKDLPNLKKLDLSQNPVSGNANSTGTFENDNHKIRIDFAPTEDIPYYWFIEFDESIDKNKIHTMMLSKNKIETDQWSSQTPPAGYQGEGNVQVLWDVSNELGVINIGVTFADAHEYTGRDWIKESYFIDAFYMDGIVRDKFRQPHKILERIIDKSVLELKNRGITADKRVVMMGFSGSAIFAQRFSVLSPKYVKAIVAGQAGGSFLMPFEKINNRTYNFPIGIADYEEERIDGSVYNFDAYKEIYQLLYTPSNDATSPAVMDYYEKDPSEDMKLLVNDFGLLGPTRLFRQSQYMKSNGLDRVYFHVYDNSTNPGNAHNKDLDLMVRFLKDVIENGESGDYTKYDTPVEEVDRLFQNNMIIRYDMERIIIKLRKEIVGENLDKNYNILYFAYIDKKQELSKYSKVNYVLTDTYKLIIMTQKFKTLDFVQENYGLKSENILYSGSLTYKNGQIKFSENLNRVVANTIISMIDDENFDFAIK